MASRGVACRRWSTSSSVGDSSWRWHALCVVASLRWRCVVASSCVVVASWRRVAWRGVVRRDSCVALRRSSRSLARWCRVRW
ncbi:hypothetical protein ACXZ9C_11730 [Streptococcus agalactiae]